ncbi:MAG: hypothetical protein FD175_982 [Beijerinckiaceae bacterium]|nr:MAG: hypothetical protein FD175_982 [Beijerinckiaceae bacterium]
MLEWLLFPMSLGGTSFPIFLFGGFAFLLGLFFKFALVCGASVGAVSLTASLLLYVLCFPLVIGLFAGGVLVKDLVSESLIVAYALIQGAGGVLGWWAGKLLSPSLRQKGEQVQ